MFGFISSFLQEDTEDRHERLAREAREKFNLSLDNHSLQVLRHASVPENHIFAVPESITGTKLRHAKLAITSGERLFATPFGLEVAAYLRGDLFAPFVAPHVEAIFKAGDTAFWLDPELWNRTPMLPNGKNALCWDYLPDYDKIARQIAYEEANAIKRAHEAKLAIERERRYGYANLTDQQKIEMDRERDRHTKLSALRASRRDPSKCRYSKRSACGKCSPCTGVTFGDHNEV